MTGTIYALASGAGRAGVAVIRVSGPATAGAVRDLTGRPMPPPRTAVRARFDDPATSERLDDGLLLWFPAPHSYTGEDVAELHVHGGPAVIAAILEALGAQRGLRLAEPGEFTRRAVLAGKMDLTAAEGLLDLIEADTDAQRRQALRQAEGALGRLYDGWRDRLLPVLAHHEAAIDFSDEDLPENLVAKAEQATEALIGAMEAHLNDDRRGERLRQGVQIAIIGAPNVGKSSLLNLLAQRDAAIVSATAGTTRDVVEVWLDLAGYPVLVADTAGIRESVDEIEAEGVRRARQWAGAADLKIAVFAADIEAKGVAGDIDIDEDTIIAVNKIDLGNPKWTPPSSGLGVFPVSVKTGAGIDGFLGGLTKAVEARLGQSAAPLMTRARHREAIQDCVAALRRARGADLPELAAEDLRLAVRALARITGAVDVEDLLDIVFRDFCIGK
ncbi:MAG: tRNA uridine-5-carboxymethylaminomethyl(34) synthesis GTPase MnmE [Alphaproteobacteria bacterium]|nr:tRNA uridine-5-carboxymethylaminomethyl(34) synthesis GTPase MnmE [Alphaproteobacteria bacterium]